MAYTFKFQTFHSLKMYFTQGSLNVNMALQLKKAVMFKSVSKNKVKLDPQTIWLVLRNDL